MRCLIATLFMISSCSQFNSLPSSSKGAYIVADGWGPAEKWASTSVPVCWTNSSPETAECEQWTENAIENQYNGRTVIKFIGWSKCLDSNQPGIRISWAKDEPITYPIFRHTYPSGYQMVTMNLLCDWHNTSVSNLKADCTRDLNAQENCVTTAALHEFGHALGLQHENVRPESCEAFRENSGTAKVAVFGHYDEKSIMIYCYYRPIVGLEVIDQLSENDVKLVNTLYSGDERSLEQTPADCGPGYTYSLEYKRCLVTPSTTLPESHL